MHVTTHRFLLLPLVVFLLQSAFLAPPVAHAQANVHVYALKDSGSCDVGSACPVDLVSLAVGAGSQDRDLGVLESPQGDAVPLHALALSPHSQLFGTDGGNLYKVNVLCPQLNCTTTLVHSVKLPAGDNITALAFHPDGRMFAGTRAGRLIVVDPKTGNVRGAHDFGASDSRLPGNFSRGFGFDGGLVFGSNGALYATVIACPSCTPATEGATPHDALALMPPSAFSRAAIVSPDLGFAAVHGLVFVAGESAGSTPVLLGTTGAQPAGSACASSGAVVRLQATGGSGRLMRCLGFAVIGAAANPILPPLIASVSFRRVVHPGRRQIVNVRASPDTVTRLVVTFPNGDSLVKKVIAGTAGRARFSYVQRASEISRWSSKAHMRVVVGSGQTETSERFTYRIALGAIDAAVTPRIADAGSGVTVYVHTWPHRRVLAYLLFPNGRVQQLKGRTGGAGWAALHGRLRINTVVSGSRTIEVIALLARGPVRISTATSLVIGTRGTH